MGGNPPEKTDTGFDSRQLKEGEHMGKDIDDLIFGNDESVPSER